MVVVVDDEDRENEGDIICAAATITADQMAFIVRHCSGLVCVSLPPAIADRLDLPLMVPADKNEDSNRTAFTVSVVRGIGCCSGSPIPGWRQLT